MLMRLIDERYTKYPHEGSRKIMQNLNKQGYDVTRNQVRYLMDKMGLQTIYPKPNTSARSRDEHKIYPYLMKSICVYYPNQVWCSDITYIRMKHGHIYLVAIMDWHSRYVIDWQLSISLEAEFCVDTLVRALENNVCGIMGYTVDSGQIGKINFIFFVYYANKAFTTVVFPPFVKFEYVPEFA